MWHSCSHRNAYMSCLGSAKCSGVTLIVAIYHHCTPLIKKRHCTSHPVFLQRRAIKLTCESHLVLTQRRPLIGRKRQWNLGNWRSLFISRSRCILGVALAINNVFSSKTFPANRLSACTTYQAQVHFFVSIDTVTWATCPNLKTKLRVKDARYVAS